MAAIASNFKFESAPQPRAFGPEGAGDIITGKPKRATVREKERKGWIALHKKLYDFFTDEMERQSMPRYQMAVDEDYADSLQWDDEEIQALLNRNQAALVYNFIKPNLLWVRGTEMRTRTDFKVLPRTDSKEAAQDAEIKTGVLKYVHDVNLLKFRLSEAFDEAATSGLSWIEDAAVNDPTQLPVYCGWESWKNILYDSCGRDKMCADWRYIFRFRDIDMDIAEAMFPQEWQKQALRSACTSDRDKSKEEFWYIGRTSSSAMDWPSVRQMGLGRRNFIDITAQFSTARQRVKVIEAWYRVPKTRYVMRGPVFDMQDYDPKNKEHYNAYQSGAVTLVAQVQMQMRVAFMTENVILDDQQSPYKHNDFPFTPIWCFRRKRDNAPYGLVREMRDPQDSLNKHMSKAQWLLASNQIVADDDAVKDWKALRRQADKPNGTIRKKRGAELRIERHQGEANNHVKLAEFDMRAMRENYGPNGDSLGLQTNAVSGRAILARQEQGSVNVQPVFDSFMLARQVAGRKRLSVCEQYITDERVIRVTGKNRGQYDFYSLNKPIYNEATGEWTFENDMTAMQADFVIDEQDYRASLRQAMAETMADMISKMPPEVGFKFLDMWVEFLDIPNKEDYVRRIRQLNGMPGDSQDPADMEINRVKQEAQQQMAAMQEEIKGQMQSLQKTAESLKAANLQLQIQNGLLKTKLENKSGELKLGYAELESEEEIALTKIGVEHHNKNVDRATSAQENERTRLAASSEKAADRQHKSDESIRDRAGSMDASSAAGELKQAYTMIQQLQKQLETDRAQSAATLAELSDQVMTLAKAVSASKKPEKKAA